MYDSSSDEEEMPTAVEPPADKLDEKLVLTSGNDTRPKKDEPWMKPIVHRPFLQPTTTAVNRVKPRQKPAPEPRHAVLSVMRSHEPFVVFLNGLNTGLGVAAPALHHLGITSELDIQRMKPDWWLDYCRVSVRSSLASR
jgi:hypothetical protein